MLQSRICLAAFSVGVAVTRNWRQLRLVAVRRLTSSCSHIISITRLCSLAEPGPPVAVLQHHTQLEQLLHHASHIHS